MCINCRSKVGEPSRDDNGETILKTITDYWHPGIDGETIVATINHYAVNQIPPPIPHAAGGLLK